MAVAAGIRWPTVFGLNERLTLLAGYRRSQRGELDRDVLAGEPRGGVAAQRVRVSNALGQDRRPGRIARASSRSTATALVSAKSLVLVVENQEGRTAEGQAPPGGEAPGWLCKTRIPQPLRHRLRSPAWRSGRRRRASLERVRPVLS